MDGDCAHLPELVRLKEKWNAVLYVDEAHGVGIRGPKGLGLAEEQQALDGIDLLIGTCGKAYGGMGAFVCAKRVIIDYLINTARPQIFSTSLPPVNLEWLRFVLKRLPELNTARKRVADMAARLREDSALDLGERFHAVDLNRLAREFTGGSENTRCFLALWRKTHDLT